MNNRQLIQRIKILTWIALVGFSVVLLFASVQQKQKSIVEDIAVEIQPLAGADSSLINKEDVKDILDQSFADPILGGALERVNVQRIERILEKNAFVKHVNSYLDAKNVLNITIEQREPIVRIRDVEGRDYYLDETGVYMPPSDHYTARVMVLTGFVMPFVPDFKSRKDYGLNEIFELILLLRADPFYLALVEQIHISQSGEILLVPKIGEHQILFGKYRNEVSKLKRLKIFYREGLPYAGWGRYKQIDLRFDNQIVCSR